MNEPVEKVSRREQILQALAVMLESHPGGRITTAALAREVGVTEAALYRHFPSKARMFEGLIEFVEEVLFSRINRITAEVEGLSPRIEAILALTLGFAERNPGISRILNGDALVGENERLLVRVNQIFERLETELRQMLREAEVSERTSTALPHPAAAQLVVTLVEGRISQFVRSGFRRAPTENWALVQTWLNQSLYRSV